MAETLYVLQLEDDKYYVGKTTNLKRRINEHCAGTGCEWTKLYAPKKVLVQRPVKDDHDETSTTKDLMKLHGIENVRGGPYCQTVLPAAYQSAIEAELRAATDACFKCGNTGHFANTCTACSRCGRSGHQAAKCYTYTTSKGVYIGKPPRDPYASDDTSSEEEEPRKRGACYRCGRTGHYSPDCYASRHKKGYELD